MEVWNIVTLKFTEDSMMLNAPKGLLLQQNYHSIGGYNKLSIKDDDPDLNELLRGICERLAAVENDCKWLKWFITLGFTALAALVSVISLLA